jgi:acetyltransferase
VCHTFIARGHGLSACCPFCPADAWQNRYFGFKRAQSKIYVQWLDMGGRHTVKSSQEVHSYPDNYHVHVRTSIGVAIFIRPLLPKDLKLFRAFLLSLSTRTVYYRFLSPIREFSEQMIAHLTQVDHKNHIALAAFPKNDSPEIMLGVARLFIEKDLSAAEISVVVVDKYQGKGIGAELFSRCIAIGRSQGVKKIWGLILPENTQMLKLARELHFNITREKDSSEYFVSLDYNK